MESVAYFTRRGFSTSVMDGDAMGMHKGPWRWKKCGSSYRGMFSNTAITLHEVHTHGLDVLIVS